MQYVHFGSASICPCCFIYLWVLQSNVHMFKKHYVPYNEVPPCLAEVFASNHLPIVASQIPNVLTRIRIVHLYNISIGRSEVLSSIGESTLSARPNGQLFVSPKIVH